MTIDGKVTTYFKLQANSAVTLVEKLLRGLSGNLHSFAVYLEPQKNRHLSLTIRFIKYHTRLFYRTDKLILTRLN